MSRYFFPMPNVAHWPFKKKEQDEERSCDNCSENNRVPDSYGGVTPTCIECRKQEGFPNWKDGDLKSAIENCNNKQVEE